MLIESKVEYFMLRSERVGSESLCNVRESIIQLKNTQAAHKFKAC